MVAKSDDPLIDQFTSSDVHFLDLAHRAEQPDRNGNIGNDSTGIVWEKWAMVVIVAVTVGNGLVQALSLAGLI